MKTCPACHKTVPDNAAVCPHAGCGKPLPPAIASLKKRPPPPGPVRLTTTAVPHTQPGTSPSASEAHRDSWRGPVATLALLLLLGLLVGGIFYAAVGENSAIVKLQKPAAPGAGDGNKPINDSPAKPRVEDVPAKPDKAVSLPTVKASDEKTAAQVEQNVEQVAKTETTEPAPPAEPLGLYSERTRKDREKWIGEVGGTVESELGVTGGLDWLARHQAEDGHWGPDCLGPTGSRCEKEHPCSGPGGQYEPALTGLAILAFQAGGNYDFNGQKYSENVRRGLDWLVARQGADGELVTRLSPAVAIPIERQVYNPRFMYEHAIATFALTEACALARAAKRHVDERYLAASIKAVKFIEDQQHDDGGWRYSILKSERSDSSISGWAMLALKTAKEADLKVNSSTISRMTAFFKRQADPLTGRTRYFMTQYLTDATTGVGMMVDEFVNQDRDSELIHLASTYLADQAEAHWGKDHVQGPDFYLWYNCTLAMFMAGGDNWKRWNDVVRNHVLSLQVKGTDCTRGSWDPNDQWGGEGGRVFSTALAVLTLEVYYRFARDTEPAPINKQK
jgi:hypothetical protein